MKLTRFGFNVLVVIYLAPLVLADIIGNTMSTGEMSDFYYYKTFFDGLLILYAAYTLFTGKATADVNVAIRRRHDEADSVVDFAQVSALEYVYCLFLALYAAANWVTLHAINKQATGVVSMATLVWSFVSIVVAILAVAQFWHLKSGKIVELTHKVVQ